MKASSHLDPEGRLRMVDVGAKAATDRRAVAEGFVVVGRGLLRSLKAGAVPKGNALEAARIAGIMAAKETHRLIPLCHPLALDHVAVDFELFGDRVRITAAAAAHGRTGIEMEALTAVAVAALTLYDMLKSLSRGITITDVRLVEKSGGKSGNWKAKFAEGKS